VFLFTRGLAVNHHRAVPRGRCAHAQPGRPSVSGPWHRGRRKRGASQCGTARRFRCALGAPGVRAARLAASCLPGAVRPARLPLPAWDSRTSRTSWFLLIARTSLARS